MIRFEDVSLTYRGASKPSLVNLNLSVGRGEFVWLVGPTGAGKTSVLKLIHRAESPSSGTVFVAEKDLSGLGRRALPRLRRKVALIDGRPRLMAGRTLLENVALPLTLGGEDSEIAERKARAALMDVGLGHKARRVGNEVSQGERLLCALARALVQAPSILLADEPTGGLDPALTEDFEGLLRQAWIRGTTVLWATCEPARHQGSTHRLVRLERGELVADSPSTGAIQIQHTSSVAIDAAM